MTMSIESFNLDSMHSLTCACGWLAEPEVGSECCFFLFSRLDGSLVSMTGS